jgi:hypothetical protein
MATKAEKAAAQALAMAMKELPAIAAATAAGSFVFTSKAIHLPLIAAGLVVVNETDVPVNDKGESATRATEAGAAKAAELAAHPEELNTVVTEPAAKLVITLNDNIAMPEVVASRGGGVGRESIYPFKTMNVNQSFFVPASEKMPKPWESLASAIANAEKKFAVVKTVPEVDGEGKPVFEADGVTPKLITVTKSVKSREKGKEGQIKNVPEVTKTRTFKAFQVEENGVKGARIWRTA